MSSKRRIRVATARGATVLAAALILHAATAISRQHPTACPDGRFRIIEGGQLAGGATPVLFDIVTLKAKQLGLGTACGLVSGIVKPGKKQTTLRARWTACGDLRRVRLSAKIASPDCGTLTGTIKAKGRKASSFRAVRSFCGDGVLDPGNGEQCDGGTGCDATSECMASNCTCQPLPTTTTIVPSSSTTTTLAAAPLLCGDGLIGAGEPCDLLALPSGCPGGDECDLVDGACTCAPIPATIGRTVTFAPPPPQDLGAMGVPKRGDNFLLGVAPGVEMVVKPDLKDPLTVVGGCTRWILACLSPPDRTLDDCTRSAPQCTTDQPWLEAQDCCPAACFAAYDAVRRNGGYSSLKAFSAVYFDAAGCFPGVRAMLGRP